MRAHKKAQEEIVGFVAIVLLVVIIGVIFLGIILRNDSPVIKESKDVRRLLDSMMEYTSDCAMGYVPNYKSLADLIQICYEESSSECKSGEAICFSLNKNLLAILDGTVKAGPENKNKGFVFKTIFAVNISAGNGTEIIKVIKGNCTSEEFVEGYTSFEGQNGAYISTLRICN